MGRTTKAVVVVAVAVVAATASLKTYFLKEYSSGVVLWDAKEAYFFITVARYGHPVSYVRYPWFAAKEYLGGIEEADDNRAFLVVVHITSSTIQRRVVKLADRANGGAGSDPGSYTPFEGRVYASCPQLIGQFVEDGHLVGGDPDDALCWWAGDRFEKATQAERQRLNGIRRLSTPDFDNDENGWSRREFGAGARDRRFTIDVGDGSRLSVNNVGVPGTRNGTVSIDLIRPLLTPEKIGEFKARFGPVNRTEYQHAFQGPE